MEMNKLLITLATLSIGGITAFVVQRDKALKHSPPQLRRVIASWTLCAASLYFGYLAYQQVTWELYWGGATRTTHICGGRRGRNSGLF